MIKIAHLFKNYYLGISFIGIIAFVIQEIPYIIMPLVKPESNPIMNMQNELKCIQIIQGVFGMLSMVLLMLIVRDDVGFFSIETTRDKVFFCINPCHDIHKFYRMDVILYRASNQLGDSNKSICGRSALLFIFRIVEAKLPIGFDSSIIFCNSYY